MLTLREVDGFDEDDDVDEHSTLDWPTYSYEADEGDRLFVVEQGSTELAQVALHAASTVGTFYGGVIAPPGGFVELDGFEVHPSARGRGVGRQSIALLRDRFPGCPFAALALNQEAGFFWAALGWTRHVHRTKPDSSVLYVTT